MNKLIVRHLDGSNPPQFQLERVVDGKTAEPVEVPSPIEFPVEGRPDSHLMLELRWYLEQFLDWPFPPLTDRAERVLESLHKWGKRAFEALFGGRWAGRLFDAATHEEYSQLHLEIASDDPKILYWPWEGLCDPEVGVLARTCQISRRLNKVRDPHPLAKDLPQDRINILLITARPYESDVQFRSISRPLIDLIAKEKLPANVTLLRPPTLDQLRTHLREHPHHYHILHFDGHGAYGKKHGHDDPHSLTMQGPIGELVFEDLNGDPDPQSASVLSELLREYHIPIVVLNACQSAMVDETAEDAFASVAAALQKSGVRSVVAMAYSLYVSGAQQFLPAFYRRLFQDGIVADAVRAGRQQAFAHPQRRCARGEFPLKDWLVPVLYEQQPVALKFRSTLAAAPSHSTPDLPAAALDRENPYGFVGRDGAVLQLERAMQRPPAAVLIHGFGGTGKTTLCRGFVHWMAATGGLGCGFIWFSFQEIRSAEFVINELTAKLFGTNALATATDQKILDLTTKLRDNKFVIVWDNFEVVCGIAATSHQPTLSQEDRAFLLDFLKQLRGGATKVLITSRSPETWIESSTCFRLRIGGLRGEERWEFCDIIVRDLGLKVDRNHSDWADLMELLEGHPLAMRVILPRLEHSSPAQLTEVVKSNILQFESPDIESVKLFSALRFVLEQLGSELQRLLIPLGMFDQFADANLMRDMASETKPPIDVGAVDRLFATLNTAGLLRDLGGGRHEMHPMLGQFLEVTVLNQADELVSNQWSHSFVNVMAGVAHFFGPKAPHQQKGGFHVYGSSMRRALVHSKRLSKDDHVAELTQSLAAYSLNALRFQEAQSYYEELADHSRHNKSLKNEAIAYFQLGRTAQEQRNFPDAMYWFRKSLEIKLRIPDNPGIARTHHQMGVIAQEQHNFALAEKEYRMALEIFKVEHDETGVANCLMQLGIVADLQGDVATAEQFHKQSLAFHKNHGNEEYVASLHYNLAFCAIARRHFSEAEHLLNEALGTVTAPEHSVFAASIYHLRGLIALEQSSYAEAEKWYQKSLSINESTKNNHGAAITYLHLGRLSRKQDDFETAGKFCIKAIQEFSKTDEHAAHNAKSVFAEIFQAANDNLKRVLRDAWFTSNIGPFPS